jgi:hypothetical protein
VKRFSKAASGFLKSAATVIKNQGKVPTFAAFGSLLMLPPMIFRNSFMTTLVVDLENQQGLVSFSVESVAKSNFQYLRNYNIRKI